MIYNIVLVSAVEQRESAVWGRGICIYSFFLRFFSHIGHYRELVTDIENKLNVAKVK